MIRLIPSIFCVLTLLGGCRDASQTLPQTPQPKVERIAADASVDDVIAHARRRVERAHLLGRPVAPMPETVQFRGVALPLYNEFPTLNFEAMLDSIARLGASHVSIVVTWRQRTIFENTIRPHEGETPSDARVKEVIAAARARGLGVMLFPIIHIDLRNDGEWRGKIAPSDVERWQQEYSDFVLHYANMAEEEGVEVLSVGSELSSMEGRERFWKGLIATVRHVYRGKLIYSSNWDHFRVPLFWAELDFIGVSSYFEVARSPSDSIQTIAARWRSHRDELIGFSRQWSRPLVLTEVGYPSVPGAALKPWDYTSSDGGADSEAQLAAYRALIDGWHEPDEDFVGLFLWHGWGHGGEADTSYSVFEKPAERLVEAWFGQPTP